MTPSYTYKASVVKVIDGDTVDLSVDLGFHVHVGIRVRLYGINAPEVDTAAGRASRDWLRANLPALTQVVVRTFKNPGDKYGRWLADIDYLGSSISDMLVERGFASTV